MTYPTPYGYDIDEIDAPKFLSRGEYELTGTKGADVYWPMKEDTTLISGLFGTSGLGAVQHFCLPYDDISGMSGCIGVNIRKMRPISDTGNTRNTNLGNRACAIMHEGYMTMLYAYGLLDGTIVTLRYGDAIAPCTSGFRPFQELNQTDFYGLASVASGEFAAVPAATGHALITGTTAAYNVLNTGARQVKLGWYADVASDQTGTFKRVKIMPNSIYGVHK